LKLQEADLVFILGGTFLMGSENGAEDEKPVHTVTLDPFWIAARTVTNSEYGQFLESNIRVAPPEFIANPLFAAEMQPVVGVSWFDAVAYCEWISNVFGHGYRLATEAEWEFAASAGSQENIYPWGKQNWEERPDLYSRFQNGPEVVGSFEPNSLGIHDMGMNVHEWCSDWYDRNYYSVSPSMNPKGPEQGTRRSSRGGSWRHAVKISRCTARSSIPPHMRYADYGFRIARNG
jgi:formylglycine-generating enzyme required for sulfatase activity